MNGDFDVLIAGGGPIGMITACTLKSINTNLNICVFDKRPEATRKHGLSIDKDAIARITGVLEKKLKHPDPMVDLVHAKELLEIFKSWKSNVIATNQIENRLTAFAREKLNIEVYRGEEYEVTSAFFEQNELNESLDSDLRKRLRNTKVVIGTDGSQSSTREAVKIAKTGQETLQHLLELKFQAPNELPKRSPLLASSEASICEGIDFETMGRKKREMGTKPATRHLMVSPKTFNVFQKKDGRGKVVKGDHAHSWTLDEISILARTDKKAKKVFDRMIYVLKKNSAHIKDKSEQAFQEMYASARITVLPMNIYTSENAAITYKDRMVLLAGDAHSGVVLARGVNKGIIESSYCVEAVTKYFHKTQKQNRKHKPQKELSLPKEFVDYQKKVQSLYREEIRWAKLKSSAVLVLNTTIKFFTRPVHKLTQFFKNLFSKNNNPKKETSVD